MVKLPLGIDSNGRVVRHNWVKVYGGKNKFHTVCQVDNTKNKGICLGSFPLTDIRP